MRRRVLLSVIALALGACSDDTVTTKADARIDGRRGDGQQLPPPDGPQLLPDGRRDGPAADKPKGGDAPGPAAKWVSVASGVTLTLNTVWGSGANDVWVGGYLGTLIHWDGSKWSKVTATTEDINAIWGTAKDNVWAVGTKGMILRYDGSAWTPATSGTTSYLYDVWGSAKDDVWAVGEKGTLVHYDGAAWKATTSTLTSALLHGVWGSGRNDVWAVGLQGAALRYDGAQWKAWASFAGNVHAIWGSGASDVWAVGAGGSVYHFDGSTWSTKTAIQPLWGVWGSGQDVWVVGDNSDIERLVGGVFKPEPAGGSKPLYGIWGSSTTDIWVVGMQGEMFRYH
jgi:hypothetical protein